MTKVSYPGVTNPKAAFEALRAYRDELIALKIRCRPMSADYLILDAATAALDTACFHFTRNHMFYGGMGHGS